MHRFPVRVFYEDTDMAGIVYHANYLKYLERGRSDWVAGLGIDQLAMRQEGLVFVVRRLEADFLAAAAFDDRLEVQTEPTSLSGARLVLAQSVLRGDRPLFRASVTLVCCTMEGAPVRLPAVLRKALAV